MFRSKDARFHSIAYFVVGVLVLGGLLTMTGGIIYTLGKERLRLRNNLENFQIETLETLVASTEDAMVSFSPEEVRNIVSVLLKDDRIVTVNIFSEIYDLYLFQASKKSGNQSSDTLMMSQLVVRDGEVLGYVQVGVDKGWIIPQVRKARNHIIVLFAVMFLAGLILVIPVIYFKILKPLNRLIDQAHCLSQGDLETVCKWRGRDEISMLGRTLDNMRSKLNESFKTMQELAVTDELTGLPNRRGFNTEASKLLHLSRRYAHPLSVALLDLDYFKRINDTYGHSVGDEVLSGFARKVGKRIRKTDLLARVGGEEFVLVMPETSINSAGLLLNDLRRVIASKPFSHGRRITVSIGVTCYSGKESLDDLLEMADKALYEAKEKGRDRVVVYSGQCPSSES